MLTEVKKQLNQKPERSSSSDDSPVLRGTGQARGEQLLDLRALPPMKSWSSRSKPGARIASFDIYGNRSYRWKRAGMRLTASDCGVVCTARSKSLTSLCRLQSHPAQYVSGIPSAAILLSISHPIRCSTRCLANVRARISGPMIAL